MEAVSSFHVLDHLGIFCLAWFQGSGADWICDGPKLTEDWGLVNFQIM